MSRLDPDQRAFSRVIFSSIAVHHFKINACFSAVFPPPYKLFARLHKYTRSESLFCTLYTFCTIFRHSLHYPFYASCSSLSAQNTKYPMLQATSIVLKFDCRTPFILIIFRQYGRSNEKINSRGYFRVHGLWPGSGESKRGK